VDEAVEASESGILESARRAGTTLRLQRMPKILITEEHVSPFLFGALRPALVIPAGLIAEVRTEELSAVLAHEFAHLRRRDPLVGWVLAVCQTVYFFHPIFHSAKRRIMFERERACDDWVVAASQSKGSVYVNALITAADVCRGFSANIGPVGAVAESFGDLKKRLIAISRNLKPQAQLSSSALVLLVILGAVCTPGILLTVRAGTPAADQSEEETLMSIHEAAADGDLERVKALIAAGADINAKDQEGYMPLHAAAQSGHTAVAKFLVVAGADLEAKADDHSFTPLHVATKAGHTTLVELLIAEGADANAKDVSAKAPLFQAVLSGSTDLVELFIAKGNDVNAKSDYYDWTPLQWANKEIAGILLDKGANIEARNKWGQTAMHKAVDKRSPELIKLLLQSGANIDSRDYADSTPLHHAIRRGHLDMVELLLANGAASWRRRIGLNLAGVGMVQDRKEIVKFLVGKGFEHSAVHVTAFGGDLDEIKNYLSAGGDINALDPSRLTMLVCAIRGRQTAVAEFLINKGADINLKGNRGASPLAWAADGRPEIARMLLDKGADVTISDDLGCTALHSAVALGHKDIVETLITKGADVNAKSKTYVLLNGYGDPKYGDEGWTPLHWACYWGDRTAIAELLIANGADVNAKTKNGRTPKSLLGQNGPLVELLRKHGAKE